MARQLSLPQRAYLTVLKSMLLNPRKAELQEAGSQAEVARYIHRHPTEDAQIILVGYSYSDPLPVHCFLRAMNGQRLADSKRVCWIDGKFYSWTEGDERIRGVVLAQFSVSQLLSRDFLFDTVRMFGRRSSDTAPDVGSMSRIPSMGSVCDLAPSASRGPKSGSGSSSGSMSA